MPSDSLPPSWATALALTLTAVAVASVAGGLLRRPRTKAVKAAATAPRASSPPAELAAPLAEHADVAMSTIAELEAAAHPPAGAATAAAAPSTAAAASASSSAAQARTTAAAPAASAAAGAERVAQPHSSSSPAAASAPAPAAAADAPAAAATPARGSNPRAAPASPATTTDLPPASPPPAVSAASDTHADERRVNADSNEVAVAADAECIARDGLDDDDAAAVPPRQDAPAATARTAHRSIARKPSRLASLTGQHLDVDASVLAAMESWEAPTNNQEKLLALERERQERLARLDSENGKLVDWRSLARKTSFARGEASAATAAASAERHDADDEVAGETLDQRMERIAQRRLEQAAIMERERREAQERREMERRRELERAEQEAFEMNRRAAMVLAARRSQPSLVAGQASADPHPPSASPPPPPQQQQPQQQPQAADALSDGRSSPRSASPDVSPAGSPAGSRVLSRVASLTRLIELDAQEHLQQQVHHHHGHHHHHAQQLSRKPSLTQLTASASASADTAHADMPILPRPVEQDARPPTLEELQAAQAERTAFAKHVAATHDLAANAADPHAATADAALADGVSAELQSALDRAARRRSAILDKFETATP